MGITRPHYFNAVSQNTYVSIFVAGPISAEGGMGEVEGGGAGGGAEAGAGAGAEGTEEKWSRNTLLLGTSEFGLALFAHFSLVVQYWQFWVAQK